MLSRSRPYCFEWRQKAKMASISKCWMKYKKQAHQCWCVSVISLLNSIYLEVFGRCCYGIS